MQKIVDVAKKYNGILKITSGQRILITNLKQEDLENIWNELGMEPAIHSYSSSSSILWINYIINKKIHL
ncbi:hypothetical protein RASY3_19820 [Ruminococcus albus SY3]|uniref:Nitrite/Sulfite reductase ferredoxin-like domain-containing protein n=1 Tax=Ruminococcus albus SY3 TaxID=1341156 RepID=A0A011UZZ3_RUMAL|nr:hypothetical protein RASY3_19820 [Ruminococcus albus SY3]